MNSREALWLAHQRQRWMLPDSSRWLRPDHAKWVRPEPAWRTPAELYERKYSPDQPRDELGKWTDGGGVADVNQSDRVRLAANTRTPATGTVSDADGRPYYQRGGHHEMPESVYKRWNLQPETVQVFKQSSTGPLGAVYRETPEGPRIGNVWEGPEGGLHRAYNQAVGELSHDFFDANGIRSDGSNMTPNQARSLLARIRASDDPRIRDFNYNMRRIQRLFRLRGGSDD
jgi:hypothetical protein